MNILLLAGTSEARALASLLQDAGHQVFASLAGATRAPLSQNVQTRIGGFGGADGFKTQLSDLQIDLVIDATHPFATQITNRSANICKELELPYLLVSRPAWTPEQSRHQIEIESAEAARVHIDQGATVFLATGRQTLIQFENLSDCRLICRQIDPPTEAFPFPNGEYLVGRPPFSVEDEIALFQKLGVEYLVVKNSGGRASASKLDAATALGIKTLMIRRPDLPDVPTVASVDEAMEWLHAHHHL